MNKTPEAANGFIDSDTVTWERVGPNRLKAHGASSGTASPLTTKGDVYGYSTTNTRIPVGSNTTVLKADSGQALGVKWEAVKDSELSISDITTNNVSISQHGFAPKLPNDPTKFLDGSGSYTVPNTVAGGVRRCFRCDAGSGTGAISVAVASNAAFDVGNPTKMTVRMWFRPGKTQNNNGLATRGNNSSTQGDWAFGFFNGSSMRPTFRVNNNAASIQSGTDLTVGRWYFLEASYDSSLASNNLKIFINGTLDTQGNYTTAITNNAVNLYVGTYFDGAHNMLGYVSEFEFCSGVVRNTTNYTPPVIITPDSNTTVHWSFNDDHQFLDDSGNSFHGTLQGTISFLDTPVRFIS